MTPNGPVGRRKVLIGLASATRAASGGMLGTALVVYVGRSGSPFAVSLLTTVFFAFAAAGVVVPKVEDPALRTAPPSHLGTVEVGTGTVQLPGTHRCDRNDRNDR